MLHSLEISFIETLSKNARLYEHTSLGTYVSNHKSKPWGWKWMRSEEVGGVRRRLVNILALYQLIKPPPPPSKSVRTLVFER